MPYFEPQLFAAAVRNKRGDLSLRDLSAQLYNISPSTLSRIEAGEDPSLRTFFVLCEWMNADPLEFASIAVGKVAELEQRIAALELIVSGWTQPEILPDCADCGGTGIVPEPHVDPTRRDVTVIGVMCETCDGTGRYVAPE